MNTTVQVVTHRMYEGSRAGFYLSSFSGCGQFMEPKLSALMRSENSKAHMVSTVNEFGDLVCVHRYD